METWEILASVAATFALSAAVAHLLKKKEIVSKTIPLRRCVEHYVMDILSFRERVERPYAALVPIGIVAIIFGALVFFGEFELVGNREMVAVLLWVAGTSLVALGAFMVKVVTSENVGVQIVKEFVKGQETAVEKVDLTSEFTALKSVNRIISRHRTPCPAPIVVSKFITLFASNLYLRSVDFWEALVDRLAEPTWSTVIFPIDDALVSESNKECLLEFSSKVLKNSGAVIPIQMKFLAGDISEINARFERNVSLPLSMLAKANLQFGDHLTKRVSGKFVYIAFACVKVASTNPSDVADVFDKAIGSGLLARFEDSKVDHVIYLLAGSSQKLAHLLASEASVHQRKTVARFRNGDGAPNVKVEALDPFVFEEDGDRVFATIIFACNESLQFKNLKKTLGGESSAK